KERSPAEGPDRPGADRHGIPKLEVQHHVHEARGHAEIDDQQQPTHRHQREREQVAHARDGVITARAEIVGDRGREVGAAGEAAEKEVPDDRHLPARNLHHHASPFPRSRKASSAPTPTRTAEPIDNSESTTTFRCGRWGLSGRWYDAGFASSRKNALSPPRNPLLSA